MKLSTSVILVFPSFYTMLFICHNRVVTLHLVKITLRSAAQMVEFPRTDQPAKISGQVLRDTMFPGYGSVSELWGLKDQDQAHTLADWPYCQSDCMHAVSRHVVQHHSPKHPCWIFMQLQANKTAAWIACHWVSAFLICFAK